MDGLITIQSNYPVHETIDRLIAIAESKGATIFARIDHGSNAAKAGLELRPTELLIFGNPKAGTFLMQENQVSGIDLPLKALAWQDEEGKTWLLHTDTSVLEERYQLMNNQVINTIEDGINAMCMAAAK